jgi:hypothetical protein
MAELPPNITDFTDAEELIKILNSLAGLYNTYKAFYIRNGFIYVHDYSDGNRVPTLWFIRLDDIQKIYKLHKQCQVDKTSRSRKYQIMRLRPSLMICGEEYFMLNGSFKLCYADMNGEVHDQDNLIFLPTQHEYIVETSSGYYEISDRLDEDDIRPYKPVKFNHKFNIFKKVFPDGYLFTAQNKFYHMIDPFDSDVSFVCADTLDVVNPETGERVKTWPLVRVCSDIKRIIQMIDELQLILPLEIGNGPLYADLFYDEHWKMYYLSDESKFYELRSQDSGKATKAALIAE